MRILAIIALTAPLLGACANERYGYLPETKVARRAADKDPMVGPVRAYNTRTMFDRLEREMPLGGPKE